MFGGRAAVRIELRMCLGWVFECWEERCRGLTEAGTDTEREKNHHKITSSNIENLISVDEMCL